MKAESLCLWRAFVCVGSVVVVLACTPQPDSDLQQGTSADGNPAAVSVASVNGGAPQELIDNIIADLARAENLDPSEISVERTESVIWPDGALGCPEPGEMYTHALVPGYWVVLRVDERQFDYRASDKGNFRRCNNSFKQQLPVG